MTSPTLPPKQESAEHEPFAEQALRQTVEHYERQLRLFDGVVSTTPDFVYLFDRQGRFQYANRRLLEVWGMTLSEVTGKTCLELGYERWHHDMHMREINQVIETKQAIKGEVPFKAPRTGVFGVYEYIFTPVLGTDGTVEFIAGTTRDVTQRKHAEDALRRSEERYRELFTSMTEGFCVIEKVDTPPGEAIDFRYIEANPAFAQQAGVHDVVGKTIREVVPGEAQEWFDIFDAVARTGEAIRFERELVTQRRVLEVYAYLVGGGATQQVGVVFHDITHSRQAEETLRAAHDTFRHLVEHSPFGIYAVDADFRLVQVSAGAQKVFQNVRPLLDRDFAEVLRLIWPEPFASEAIGRFRHTLETGEPYHSPSVIERRFDTAQVEAYDWRIERLTLPDGRLGVVCHFYDLSERQQYEAALRESEERLKNLAAELESRVEARTEELCQSQEHLRALATELNLAEQRERKRLAAELHDHLQQILVLGKLKLGQGKRLAQSASPFADVLKEVDDVLTEALTYTRTLVAELSPPVLRDHGLAAGLKWLGEYMERHGLTVTVAVPETDRLSLPEDQAILLFQSVRELLINSAKHAGTGRAAVRMTQDHGALRIDVRDEGTGFHPSMADTRQDSSKFGLFSIRERMKAVGGSFEVRSSPGRGTMATLVVPLGGAQAAETLRVTREASSVEQKSESEAVSPITHHPSRPDASPITHHTSRPEASPITSGGITDHPSHPPIRVLLVDDHAIVREGLRTVLESYADVEVVGEAADGQAAVALAEHVRPTVVVMDINMPQMNGIEATRIIRSRYPDTKVIGLSVNPGGENQTAMKTAGAALLLTKEAAVDQLYAAIQEAL